MIKAISYLAACRIYVLISRRWKDSKNVPRGRKKSFRREIDLPPPDFPSWVTHIFKNNVPSSVGMDLFISYHWLPFACDIISIRRSCYHSPARFFDPDLPTIRRVFHRVSPFPNARQLWQSAV